MKQMKDYKVYVLDKYLQIFKQVVLLLYLLILK